jgi:hypothetical protein
MLAKTGKYLNHFHGFSGRFALVSFASENIENSINSFEMSTDLSIPSNADVF